MLPGMDGLSIIRKLRESRIDVPALFASALGEVDDRVRGLRSGGDDCLVKPFAFAELLARIEALVRPSTTVAKETVLRVGDLELELVARTATLSRRGLLFDNGPWPESRNAAALRLKVENIPDGPLRGPLRFQWHLLSVPFAPKRQTAC